MALAEGPADVLYEMLRFPSGSFAFEEGDVDAAGERRDVEDVISAAEQLVVEWARCMGVQAQAVRQKSDALLTRRAAAQSSRTAVPQAGAAD